MSIHDRTEEAQASLPPGYTIRFKPAKRSAIGAQDGWLVDLRGERAFKVEHLDELPAAIARHQASGSPTRPPARSRALQRDDQIRAAAERGASPETIAHDMGIETQYVLRLLRQQRHPRFVDADQEPTSRRPVPTRRSSTRARWRPTPRGSMRGSSRPGPPL